MPTYDYRCDACGHELEIFHSMKDAPKRKCPSCGKLKLVKLIGAGGGVIFKGSGFYETDYRSDSYKRDASADTAKSKESKSDSGKSETGKSDSKSETKSDSKPAKAADSKKKSEPKAE